MTRRARRVLAILTLAFGVAGCAVQSPPKPSIANAAQIRALLARDADLNSLQTAAVMDYHGPNGRFKAREQLVVRRPDSLRVEAMSPLGVALIVTADHGQLAIFDPSKNTLTRGVADSTTLSEVARIPLAPHQAVRLLLGLPPDPWILSAAPQAAGVENGVSIVRFTHADGIEELGFSGDNLAMVRRMSRDHAFIYEVHYSDYRDIGALMFPHTIAADFADTGAAVTFKYTQPLVDSAVPDSAFVLLPGPQTKELRLGAAAAPSRAS